MASSLVPRRNPNHQRKPARWASLASRLGGKRPMTYEAMAHGSHPIADELAGMIRAARASGDHAVVAKLYAPIWQAFRGPVSAGVTPAMEVDETELSGKENFTQMRHRCHPTRETARARLRALDRYLGKIIEIRQALVAELGLQQ